MIMRVGFYPGMTGWKTTRTSAPPATSKKYIIGMSLGQHDQWTALVVIERIKEEGKSAYHVLNAERFTMGSQYQDIARRLKHIWERIGCLDSRQNSRELVIDITGIGESVIRLFKRQGIRVKKEVIIVNGKKASRDEKTGQWNVPKKDLVGALQVLFQSGRLKIAEGIPDAQLIIDELVNFKDDNIKAGVDDSIDESWRENPNDDYVLAIAVALWDAEQFPSYQITTKPAGTEYKNLTDWRKG